MVSAHKDSGGVQVGVFDRARLASIAVRSGDDVVMVVPVELLASNEVVIVEG